MADGSISFVEGLGYKAQDSNELRRKQKVGDSQTGITKNPSSLRTEQHALFEEQLTLEAEERARCELHQQQQQQEVFSTPTPKTLFNARGIPYLEGDPNMGYGEADTKPRQPWSPKGQSNQTTSTHPSHTLPPQALNKPRQAPAEPKTKPKNWASLLQSQSSSFDMKLEYHPDLFRGKEAQVEIDIERTDVGLWNNIQSSIACNFPPPATSVDLPENNAEAANNSKESASSQHGSLEEEKGNNKVANSCSQQTLDVISSPATQLSRSAAKKAAKIATKMKDKEPPDIKLMMGGSTKAGKLGRQKSSKGSFHGSGK
ncbi:hypothetical protein RHMOL_Rhmol11G0018200 [Rhododendron molle]|uniref:Uncharacterized protein n=1 Tax=Rhododendron molle TaxID=49168 RepID=A0ACC0LN60_RHOML|nr:hypothetical protein RHMOL_Rhmol11G0018200 [Rhododendron molle]